LIPKIDPYLFVEQIARTRSGIKLLNVYKGLPISYGVSIHSIGSSEIQVHSNRNQLACLYYQRETYLQGEELPFIIRSQVMSLHLSKEDAVLSNLEIAPNNIGKRAQIRVEPEEHLPALIKFDRSPSDFFVPVADISAEGAGIYFENYMFPAKLCQPGNEMTLTVWLPDVNATKRKKLLTKPLAESRKPRFPSRIDLSKGEEGKVVLTTRGKVISIHSEFHSGRYRVGLKLFFQDLSRTVILHYISQRQSEIIRDLSVLTDELYSRKR
jgi:hypothetical protein